MGIDLLYPTRAVTAGSTQSVARLNAQLARALATAPRVEPGAVRVLQASVDSGDAAGRPHRVEQVPNGVAPRATARLLKGVSASTLAGIVRRAGWYTAVERRLRRERDQGRAPAVVVTNDATSVVWLRDLFRGWERAPTVVLWLHNAPAGAGSDVAFDGVVAADALVVPSRALFDRLWSHRQDRGLPTPCWTVPHPVDRAVFHPLAPDERRAARERFARGLDGETALVGFASSLAPHKGLGVLALALAAPGVGGMDRPAALLVAGEEASDDPRLARARESGVDVRFTGRLAPDELRRFYGAVDILAVPSSWSETFGLVALEALACGAPVVASRVGGLAEALDGVPGAWLVDEITAPDAWARTLTEALTAPANDRDPALVVDLAAWAERWTALLDRLAPAWRAGRAGRAGRTGGASS
jgi:glycosyltransferase involved in cell wall biosynthesis